MKPLFSLLFLFLFLVIGDAQENNSPQSNTWIRVESPEKDFSIEVPSNLIFNKEDAVNRIHSFTGGNRFDVSMQEDSNALSDFQSGLQYIKDKEKYKFVKMDDFLIMQYKGEGENWDHFYLWLNMASKKGKYVVSVTSKNESPGDHLRFLRSIRLNGKPLFPQKDSSVTDQKSISISSFQTSPEVLNALQQKDSKQSKPLKLPDPTKAEKDPNVYSRDLIILRKPRASYTDNARQNGVQGTVKLKITFLANGKIGDIYLVTPLKGGLDNQAFKAARKIKFLPAEKDGKPVDVTKTIEYSFSIY